MKRSSDNKKQRKFKASYCSNCNSTGHVYKSCTQPVTSYGVIMVSILDDDKVQDSYTKDHVCDKTNRAFTKQIKTYGIKYNDKDGINTFCRYKDRVRFLMIRRKHTLGFLEFVRGRYSVENVDGIIFLFKQMVQEEIDKIGKMEFDELWSEVWPNGEITHKNEYARSKAKFEQLKNGSNQVVTLDFYTTEIKPSWSHAEWGFPKGRRNYQEDDMTCGVREFEEESGYTEDEYTILDRIRPLDEEFIGTNGINYRHVYYVGISNNNRDPRIDKRVHHQANEVGDIALLTYNEAINLIRPHHIDRKKLLTELYMYTINYIIDHV